MPACFHWRPLDTVRNKKRKELHYVFYTPTAGLVGYHFGFNTHESLMNYQTIFIISNPNPTWSDPPDCHLYRLSSRWWWEWLHGSFRHCYRSVPVEYSWYGLLHFSLSVFSAQICITSIDYSFKTSVVNYIIFVLSSILVHLNMRTNQRYALI
jgi:hypothetical protein